MTGKKKDRIIAALVISLAASIALGAFLYIKANEGPQYKVYFLKGERLVAVGRPLKPDENPLKAAALSLLRGPSADEIKEGYFSAIPKKTRLLGVRRAGRIALISFSPELERYGGGGMRVQKMIAQIVYTMTEQPGIEMVQIKVGNRTEVMLGGEGYVIDKPLSREEVRP